jgi:hypothetical protein
MICASVCLLLPIFFPSAPEILISSVRIQGGRSKRYRSQAVRYRVSREYLLEK